MERDLRKNRSRRKGRSGRFPSLLSILLAVSMLVQMPMQAGACALAPGALNRTEAAETGEISDRTDSAQPSATLSDSAEKRGESGGASPSDGRTSQASRATASDGGLYDEDGFLTDGDVLDDLGAAENAASYSDAEELPDGRIEDASPADAEELLPDGLLPAAERSFPAQSFSGSAGGVHVEADAEEGVFPEGTEMKVTAIPRREALRAAEEAADAEKEVKDAVGVDISFLDEDGKEIEPDGGVSVSLSLEKAIEGEEFSVLHKEEDGSVETVTEDADARGADFTADSFSVYVISGTASPAIATYVFHNEDGTVLSTQKVKNGDTLYAPASPEKTGYVFRGWAEEEGQTAGELFSEKDVSGLTESVSVDYYPAFEELHYVFFADGEGRIVNSREGTAGTSIDLTSVSIPIADNEAVESWYRDSALTEKVESPFEIGSEDLILYPKIAGGHWLKFDTDGGSYISPQFVAQSELPERPENPVKQGFTFVRWEDADGKTFAFDSALTADTDIRAVWTDRETASYTVIYWQQSRTDSWQAENAEKTYEFYASETVGPVETGTAVTSDSFSSRYLEEGFQYNSSLSTTDTTVLGDGSTVVNVYYDRKVVTVTFQVRDDWDIFGWFVTTYTVHGLYGAAFDWNGTEPAKTDRSGNIYGWYCEEDGSLYYFLDTFVFADGLTSVTLTREDALSPRERTDIRIYLQNTDGSYPDEPDYTSATSRGSTWEFGETFDGYTVDSYKRDSEDWNSTVYGGSVSLSWNTRVLSIRYRRNSYTVSFQNGGESYRSVSLKYGEPLEKLKEVPDPESHDGSISQFRTSFEGWYLDQAAAAQPLDYSASMPSHHLALYARWTGRTCAVRIHTGADSAGTKTMKVEAGGRVSRTDMPLVTRGGESFGGGTDAAYQITLSDEERFVCWVTKDESGKDHEFSFDSKITGDLDLYPYIIDTKSYHIFYDLNGGSGETPVDTNSYTTGVTAGVLSASGITGPESGNRPYFQYWYIEGSDEKYYPGDSILIPDHDLTLHAFYSAAPETVTLTYYMCEPGSGTVAHAYQYKDSEGNTDLPENAGVEIYDIDAAPLKEAGFSIPDGYVFRGWSTEKGGKTAEFAAGQAAGADSLPSPDNTLYAVFAKHVTLTAVNESRTYDGYALTSNEIAAEGLPDGYTAKALLTGSQTDAGTSANEFFSYEILDSSENVVNGEFDVATVPGTLTVEKAVLTVTTGSATKEYDGEPLEKKEAGISGFVNGETAPVTATGSQTDVGTSRNTYAIDWESDTATAKQKNYQITEELGTLEVTKTDVTVHFIAGSATRIYDGTALTDGDVSVVGLPEGFRAVEKNSESPISAAGSQTDAGTGKNIVNGCRILDKDGRDVTEYFTNITKEDGTLTVTKRNVTLRSASAEKEYDGSALTAPEVNVSGDGFVDGEVSGLMAEGSITKAGSTSNPITYTENPAFKADNYEITIDEGTLTVTQNETEITVTAGSADKTYDGTPLTEAGYDVTGLPDGFTAQVTTVGSVTDAGSEENRVASVVIKKGDEDVTDQFSNIIRAAGTLTVTPRTVNLKSESKSRAYDGTALTAPEVSVSGDGFVDGEVSGLMAEGSITKAGSVSNTITYTENPAFKAENYVITTDEGTLTVTQSENEIVVTAGNAEKLYDGTPLTEAGYDVTGLPDGFTAEAAISGSITDAGEADNVIGKVTIFDSDGDDATGNFAKITKNNGTLTVTKRWVVLSSRSESRAYDGSALTAPEVSVTGDGFVDGEVSGLMAEGSITKAGSVSNTIAYTETPAFKADNYEITIDEGTLTVTQNETEITVTAGSADKTYDGTPLTEAGYDVTGLPDGFTAKVTTEGSVTDAESAENKVASVVIKKGDEDVTDQFSGIQMEAGMLTVTKALLTVKTEGGEKQYDGTALTNPDIVITGLAEGERVGAAATGAQTEVGRSQNGCRISWGTAASASDASASDASRSGAARLMKFLRRVFLRAEAAEPNAKEANYRVVEELGTLRVTPNRSLVTIKAPSKEKVYDGTALTESTGVTAEGLPQGFEVSASAEGSQTDAGTSENVVDSGFQILYKGEDKKNNFENVQLVNGTLEVKQRPITITTGTSSKPYDGTALRSDEVTIGGDGFAEGEAVPVTADGVRLYVGKTQNSCTISWNEKTRPENYALTESLGTLEVTPNESLVLRADSDTKTYDGTPLEKNSVTAENLPDGHQVEAVVTGSRTDVEETAADGSTTSSTPNVIQSWTIRDAAGVDVKNCFQNVTVEEGSLSVTPAALTIRTGSASKKYNGTPLMYPEATVQGLQNGETAEIVVTGSQTERGSSDNTYRIAWESGSAKKSNYREVPVLGKLTVTETDSEVVLRAASATKVYDGSPLTESNVEAEGLPGGCTVEAETEGSITDVTDGGVPNKVKDGFVIRDADGRDVTGNFTNITRVDGTLTILPQKLRITVGSASKKYDGTPLFCPRASVSGVVDGELITVFGEILPAEGSSPGRTPADGATHSVKLVNSDRIRVTVRGSRTVPGTSENVCTIDWGTTRKTNYEVEKIPGTLEVTRNDDPVTLTAASAEKAYDGTALTKPDGVTAEGLPEGFQVSASAEGSQTEVGTSENVVGSGFRILNAEGEDVTAYFTNVVLVSGSLTVTPADRNHGGRDSGGGSSGNGGSRDSGGGSSGNGGSSASDGSSQSGGTGASEGSSAPGADGTGGTAEPGAGGAAGSAAIAAIPETEGQGERHALLPLPKTGEQSGIGAVLAGLLLLVAAALLLLRSLRRK